MHPTVDSDARKRSLNLTHSLQCQLMNGSGPPLNDFIDVRPFLEQAIPDQAMLSPDSLNEIRKVSRASRRVKKYFEDSNDKPLSRMVRPVVLLKELEEKIECAIDPNGRILDSASDPLYQIRRTLRLRQENLREKLRSLLNQAIRQGYAAEHQSTMRAGRMVLPVHAEAKRKIKGFVHDSSASGQTVYIEPVACLDLGNEIRVLEIQERQEEERILRALTSRVRELSDVIDTNLKILGRIDVLHAKAKLSIELGGVIPTLSEKPILEIREGKNPALCLSHDSDMVIPLTLSIGNETRTLVITGPNAGGKTVAMKSCGLMLVLLSCGIPIPVHPESTFGLFTKILAEIGDEQSMEQDLSTFSARISGLKQMCATAKEGILLLIDEIGTGTDPVQGAALAQAILEHLTASGALTIVTTHHGTLKAYAHETDGVMNGSMDFDEQTLQPTFLFRQGLPGSSYAFRIASQLKFNPELLIRARKLVGEQELTLESLIANYRAEIARLESDRMQGETEKMPLDKSNKKPTRIKPGKAAPIPSTNLKAGDQAVIDGGNSPCEIVSIQGRYAVVIAGNMRMKIEITRLTSIDSHQLSTKGKVEMSPPQIRIDVRGLCVNDALRKVQKLVDQGMSTGLPTLEIIHGIGTGALRNAIHNYLNDSENSQTFQCLDSNPGVTFVNL